MPYRDVAESTHLALFLNRPGDRPCHVQQFRTDFEPSVFRCGLIDTGVVEQFLGFLTEGGRRLSILINDLLAYTRAGASAAAADLATADSSVVLQHMLLSLAEAIRESGATVTHDQLPHVNSEMFR